MGSDKYKIVKFENLCTNPEYEMNEVADFLGIEYSKVLLSPTVLGNNTSGNNFEGETFEKELYLGDIVPYSTRYEFLFTEAPPNIPVTIAYHCDPHPWMTGTVVVSQARF